MTTILKIELLDKGFGCRGHNDLLFSIPALDVHCTCDLYFFQYNNSINSFKDLAKEVALLIRFWLVKVIELDVNSTILLPIDFSDEYTGCLKVKRIGKAFELFYGFSRHGAMTTQMDSLEEFCKLTDDFEQDSEMNLVVDEANLIETLNAEIKKLDYY